MAKEWTNHEVETNGFTTHYVRTGRPGPALLLLHGLTDAGLCWTRVARELEADYDVIMADARGHGRSGLPPAGGLDAMPDDLLALIDILKLDQPTVLGHSLGAASAAAAAGKRPGVIGRLLLEDPPWFPADMPPRPPATDWMEQLKGQSVEALMAICRRDNPLWDEAEVGPWAQSKFQFNADVMKSPRLADWRVYGPSIACPALLITGSPSAGAIISQAVAEEAKGVIPRLEVVQLEGAGHNIRRERWEGYVAAVKAFLAA